MIWYTVIYFNRKCIWTPSIDFQETFVSFTRECPNPWKKKNMVFFLCFTTFRGNFWEFLLSGNPAGHKHCRSWSSRLPGSARVFLNFLCWGGLLIPPLMTENPSRVFSTPTELGWWPSPIKNRNNRRFRPCSICIFVAFIHQSTNKTLGENMQKFTT